MDLYFITLLIFSYLLGSIPNALWIGKVFKNIDVREYGSGNVGATNATRVLGWKLGFLTFLLDVLKGSFFVMIARYMNMSDYKLVLIGFVAIIGHSFSIYLKFKGGKAVATSLGVLLVLIPKVILILLLVFFAVFLKTKYVSLASIISAILLPIITILVYNILVYNIFTFIIGVIVVLRHKSNILNLINGKEDKFSDKALKK